jgi:hypothetical protein
VDARLACRVSRSTLRQILKAGGLSWKKCKKLLSQANPVKRQAFVEQFQLLFERMCRDELCLVYVDEAHFHQDLDFGYTWAPVGEPLWRANTSPPLCARINWYGTYDFSQGQVFNRQEGKCNSQHTVQFLRRLVAWLKQSGASLHRQPGHLGAIRSLKRGPDGLQLASCGDDGVISLWDLQSRNRLHILRRDRPYERMDITGLTGITDAQRTSLITLGAIVYDS